MNRTVLSKTRSRRSAFRMWLVALFFVAAVAGLTSTLVNNRDSPTAAEEAALEVAVADAGRVTALQLDSNLRAADAFSVELDLLRRQAAIVANRDAASAYAQSLETLAQAGRQAYVDARLPTTANGYVVYLDNLRRQGQGAHGANNAPADANEYSEWLDQLRRMSR